MSPSQTILVPIEPGHLAVELATIDGGERWPIVGQHLTLLPCAEVVGDWTVQRPDGSTVLHSELDAEPGVIGVGSVIGWHVPA